MRKASVEHYDVAIVLGARILADGTPSPAMARRVAQALALLHSGQVSALLMTGGATSSAVPEALIMRDLALIGGAAPHVVHMEDRALNTIQNALYCAPVLRQHGWTRAVVVTDSFHVPRAGYIFRRLGLRVALAGARPQRPGRDWWLAYLREAAAIVWTILRVEYRRYGQYSPKA